MLNSVTDKDWQALSVQPVDTPVWQQILAAGFSTPDTLLKALNLQPGHFDFQLDCESPFRMRVPATFVARMEPGNPKDPLLLQVLASMLEHQNVTGFTQDPLAESDALAAPGLLHKYPGRVLLTVTGACAIHCRYCFRRHFPYSDRVPKKDEWQAMLDYIAGDSDIREVILSGGDPLTLNDNHLLELILLLRQIPHLTTLRIHTRTPVVVAQRVTSSLLQTLEQWSKKCVFVLHVNHPAEIDGPVQRALRALGQSIDLLLNQSVLLAGINNQIETLTLLSEKLFDCGVLPYYLHMLDPVQGSAHFNVPDDEAKRLIHAMRDSMPGYLVPRLVRELPGALSKQPL